MKNENKNFLYNIIYQLLTFIIPFITVPYTSRVLGVENIGIYSYTYSIVYMFMLTGMLGISNYGNRSIAAVRDDKKLLSKTFSSIYCMQVLINLVVIACYVVYLSFVCTQYVTIAWIQGIFLLSICFDVNWFFFGIEKFKLTITRNLIIKVISVFCVFIFVHSKQDLWIYTLIMSCATLFSQAVLVVLLHSYVKFQKVSIRDIFVHFKGILILFVPVLAFGIYKVMDKTMIGLFSTVTQVGYYENAEKIMNIPAAIISALGTVMLPRMAYLFNNCEMDYKKPILESMKLVSKLSTIMFCGLILVANDAVIVLFGNEFKNSASILMLLSMTVIASAWANVIRTQFLIPLKKDDIYIKSTIGAAIINLIFNIFLIKKYAAIGACIGTIVAEYFVVAFQIYATKKELEYAIYLKLMLKDLIVSGFIVSIAFVASAFVTNIYIRLTLKILISVILFVLINREFIFKEFFGRK